MVIDDDVSGSDESALLDLNRRSFRAEDRHDGAELEPILHDGFEIVRANGTIEDKQTMLRRVGADTSGRTRAVDEETVRTYGDAGVVRSRVTLTQSDGELVGRYWNTKVFVRQDGDWRCIAWHVTAAS